jgi:uncharacterized LabA/DUF88 family protein
MRLYGNLYKGKLMQTNQSLSANATSPESWLGALKAATQLVADLQRQLAEVERGVMQSQSLAAQQPVSAKQDRVAIFVDGSNLFYAARKLGIQVEYRKLKDQLKAGFSLSGAFVYVSVDSTKPEQLRFLSYLNYIGYMVTSKELVKRADGSQKANLDVEIALDMTTKLVDSYDTAVLVSGDGDLECAVEEVQRRGKQVVVVALRSMTSDALRRVANRYIDLADIQDKICKEP